MPPKIKITKEAILEAAFLILREHGILHVNARELAKFLNCSTQPIFRAYSNMDELKLDLFKVVEAYYNQYVENGINHSNPFLGMGLAYVDFSRKESNMFKLLFMNEHYKIKSFFDMIEGDDDKEVVTMIAAMSGLEENSAKELFIDIWLITHGIASMMATNTCNLKESEIEKILKDAFLGFLRQLKEDIIK